MSAPVVSDAIRAKSDRLLLAGAVTVECAEDGLSAVVVGDHGTYTLTRDERDGWTCPCPARTRRCSHVEALSRVVDS